MLQQLKNLFRPPETKSSRTARLIQFESGGRARWTPRDYAALTREGYVCNAIVHRAVKLVAENVAGATYLVYEGAVLRDPHPLRDLLARPNPRQEGAAFLEAVCAHLLLAGNAYIEAVMVDGQESKEVRELYALRPDRMRVVPGPDGWPEAYDYAVGARSVRFDQKCAAAADPASGAVPPAGRPLRVELSGGGCRRGRIVAAGMPGIHGDAASRAVVRP